MEEIFIKVPTSTDGVWSETTFNSREEFKDYVFKLFKVPGEYNFNQDSLYLMNKLASLKKKVFIVQHHLDLKIL
jgi:hypothetical protein